MLGPVRGAGGRGGRGAGLQARLTRPRPLTGCACGPRRPTSAPYILPPCPGGRRGALQAPRPAGSTPPVRGALTLMLLLLRRGRGALAGAGGRRQGPGACGQAYTSPPHPCFACTAPRPIPNTAGAQKRADAGMRARCGGGPGASPAAFLVFNWLPPALHGRRRPPPGAGATSDAQLGGGCGREGSRGQSSRAGEASGGSGVGRTAAARAAAAPSPAPAAAADIRQRARYGTLADVAAGMMGGPAGAERRLLLTASNVERRLVQTGHRGARRHTHLSAPAAGGTASRPLAIPERRR